MFDEEKKTKQNKHVLFRDETSHDFILENNDVIYRE